MNTLSVNVEGMSCGHCVKHVEQALGAVPGVRIQSVRVGSAVLSYDPAKTSEKAIVDSLTEAGYPARKSVGEGSANTCPSNGGCCGGH